MSKQWDGSVTPESILNEADADFGMGWNTDSVLSILSAFVVQHASPAQWRKHVRVIAGPDSVTGTRNKSTDINGIGPKTAVNIVQNLEVPEHGGEYQQAIVDAAVVLCGAGRGSALYRTQYSSGTTLWVYDWAPGFEDNPNLKCISVARNGEITW